MDDAKNRLTQPEHPPSDAEIAAWVGDKAYEYWTLIQHLIEAHYPGVFVPEWLFGGKKNGWSLRYKKNKSFCTLIPEKHRCVIVIVFGAEERAKVEAARAELSPQIVKAYDDATTYHDGKWLFLAIENEEVVKDVFRLLTLKRKPKK